MSKNAVYTIYSDGAYSSLKNQGGIGFVILNQDDKVIARFSKMYKNTTNQRMEQLAAIVALESIKVASDITIFTDSQYVVCTYTKNWKRKANLDLWKRFDEAIGRHNSVNFLHVYGHKGNKYNEIVDELAYNASNETEYGNNS